MTQLQTMFKKILKVIIYLLVFLMPIFWLPFSVEAFDFNKVYLLIVLVMAGLLLWLGNMIFKEKKLVFRWSLFDPFVLLFMAVLAINSLFSVDRATSLWGFYGKFFPGLWGYLAMAGFYFLITNNIKKDEVQKIIKIFIYSCLAVAVNAYLAIFGGWAFLNNLLGSRLPAIMSLRSFVLVSGSLEALAVFAACACALILAFLALDNKGGRDRGNPPTPRLRRASRGGGVIGYIALFAMLGLLIAIDFSSAWLVLLLSLIMFLVFSFWKRVFKEDVNRLTLTTVFAILALVFLAASPVRQFLNQTVIPEGLPQELVLNQKTSWDISWQGFREHWLLGAGAGNFHYVFAKFKPAVFLNTQFWQLRFDRAGSYIAELFAEGGAIVSLAYLALLAMFILISYFFIASFKSRIVGSGESDKTNKNILVIPLLTAFFALLFSQIFYYQNTILAFMFWLVIALAVVSWGDALREKSFAFKEFPEAGLVFGIVFWVLLVGAAFLYFSLGKYYLADVYYRQFLVNSEKNLPKLETAARIAPDRTTYHIVLSRAYLQKFLDEAQKPAPDRQAAAVLVNGAVLSAKTAIEKSPNMVAAQETAGIVYREIQGAVTGAREWAFKSFQAALALEPKNPALLTEIGKILLLDEKKDEALSYFQQATAMKPDYADAALQIAYMEDSEGKPDEAKARLENLVRVSPFSVEAHFQLGRVYFNSAEYERAKEQFETALALFPNHSNSLYSLALVYEKQGDKQMALEMLEKVLALNPDNQDVKAKISSLRGE